jgi:hypothetical protein
VTSTLDGLAARSHLIHWQAFPSGPSFDVSEVDYLIDGKQLWVEHNAPYFYRDDGNYLVTSFLKPGKHVLHRAGGRLGRAGRHRLGDRRCLSGALTARRAGGHLEAWQSAGGTPAGYAPLVISAHCGRGWSEGQFPFHTYGGQRQPGRRGPPLSPGLVEIWTGMATGHDGKATSQDIVAGIRQDDLNGWCNDALGHRPATGGL